jgi:hypothetical protein
MSSFKDVAVHTALHASGVENVIGDEASQIYLVFKNIVPEKLRKRLTADETATIILGLCGLTDDQVFQLNLDGRTLLRNELSMFGKMAFTTIVEALADAA